MKVFLLSDIEADWLLEITCTYPLGEKLRLQFSDPLLGAPGERTILVRQGTPPLMMANFDSAEDAEAVWRAMASQEDRLALAADVDVILDDEITWAS